MNKARIDAKRANKKRAWESRIAKSKTIRCHYCGIPLAPQSATREHIKPQASGGADNFSNIAMCCRACNSKRSSKPYAEFKAMMLPTKRENLKIWPK